MIKRAFDIVVSAIVLLASLPLFIVISLTILLTDPGPIFYRAKRIGRRGKEFGLYKFRSMHLNADKMGPAITVANDPRITPVGHVLRSTKLDELPQFLNVLRGDMSIVGPRPEDPLYVEMYTSEQRRLLDVRPGITSLASIIYRSEEELLTGENWQQHYIKVVMPQKLSIDMEYISRANMFTDISIIVRTFWALFR